jgi:hypothetical protein
MPSETDEPHDRQSALQLIFSLLFGSSDGVNCGYSASFSNISTELCDD